MFLQNALTDPMYFVTVVLTIMVSITIHELAHGYMAIRLGDDTPIEQGRMTFAPLVHMGWMSMIALVVAGIAWGSMPINPTRLRGRFGQALVAIAGPVSNLLLALISLSAVGLWMRMSPQSALAYDGRISLVFLIFGFTNIHLAIFNLLPIPLLDGSHIAANFLPKLGGALRTPGGSGTALAAFVVVFIFASRLISPASVWIADQFLKVARGY